MYVDIKNLTPRGCLSLPRGYIHIKSDFKENFLKLATNMQSDTAILLISKFCPQGLSAPTLGLYTCIKHKKIGIKSDFKEIFLKLATNGQSDKAFLWLYAHALGLDTCLKL